MTEIEYYLARYDVAITSYRNSGVPEEIAPELADVYALDSLEKDYPIEYPMESRESTN